MQRSAQALGKLLQVGEHAPVQRLQTPALRRRQLFGNLEGFEVSERAADATQFGFQLRSPWRERRTVRKLAAQPLERRSQ